MRAILSLGLTIAIVVSSPSSSQAIFNAKSSVKLYYGLGPTLLHTEDSHEGQFPVTATADATVDGNALHGNVEAEFNRLHVKSSAVAAESSSPYGTAVVSAVWDDALFFWRNGQSVSEGIVEVTVHVDGVLEIHDGGFAHAGSSLSIQGGGGGLAFEFVDAGSNLAPDMFYRNRNWNHTNWSASEGLPIRLDLYATASAGPGQSSAFVDFSSTAEIVNVSYSGLDGLPDPTVTMSSASGYNYGIPEPGAAILAPFAICFAWLYRGRRTTSA